jgi:hypothetical protein
MVFRSGLVPRPLNISLLCFSEFAAILNNEIAAGLPFMQSCNKWK